MWRKYSTKWLYIIQKYKLKRKLQDEIKPLNAIFQKKTWVQGPKKRYFKLSDTQIQLMTKAQKYPRYIWTAGGWRMQKIRFPSLPSVPRSDPRCGPISEWCWLLLSLPLVLFLHCVHCRWIGKKQKFLHATFCNRILII